MVKYIGKEVRVSKGFTVRGLASAAQVAQSTISKWENGSSIPDLNVLAIVADTLDCNPWDLVEFIKEK